MQTLDSDVFRLECASFHRNDIYIYLDYFDAFYRAECNFEFIFPGPRLSTHFIIKCFFPLN